MADKLVKQALIAELTAAREELTLQGVEMRRSLSIIDMLKRNLRDHPVVCYTGAAVVGLIISRAFTSRRAPTYKVPEKLGAATEKAGKAAVALTVLKFALDFAKPAMLRWTSDWMSNRFTAPPPQQRDGIS